MENGSSTPGQNIVELSRPFPIGKNRNLARRHRKNLKIFWSEILLPWNGRNCQNWPFPWRTVRPGKLLTVGERLCVSGRSIRKEIMKYHNSKHLMIKVCFLSYIHKRLGKISCHEKLFVNVLDKNTEKTKTNSRNTLTTRIDATRKLAWLAHLRTRKTLNIDSSTVNCRK